MRPRTPILLICVLCVICVICGSLRPSSAADSSDLHLDRWIVVDPGDLRQGELDRGEHQVEIGLFTTAVDTLDNRRVIIPNGTVIAGTIENHSHNVYRRVDIDVGVAYDSDLDKVREVLEAAAAEVPGRHPEGGHQIILLGLGGSSVDWQVRVHCEPKDYWDVWDATVLATKKALDAAGISIPFPQMDVHMDKPA